MSRILYFQGSLFWGSIRPKYAKLSQDWSKYIKCKMFSVNVIQLSWESNVLIAWSLRVVSISWGYQNICSSHTICLRCDHHGWRMSDGHGTQWCWPVTMNGCQVCERVASALQCGLTKCHCLYLTNQHHPYCPVSKPMMLCSGNFLKHLKPGNCYYARCKAFFI